MAAEEVCEYVLCQRGAPNHVHKRSGCSPVVQLEAHSEILTATASRLGRCNTWHNVSCRQSRLKADSIVLDSTLTYSLFSSFVSLSLSLFCCANSFKRRETGKIKRVWTFKSGRRRQFDINVSVELRKTQSVRMLIAEEPVAKQLTLAKNSWNVQMEEQA